VTPVGGDYDVWQHAAALGVHVRTGVLRGTRWGEYHHGERVIVLRCGMTELQQRCTMAHELVHAERGEVTTGEQVLDARQERRADRIAALRLVTWTDYVRACRTHRHERALVADELRVTNQILRAYERELRQRPALRHFIA
jgi:Zn-dependent peptidase ImmA (M78 family)